jgi:hypothetical protein
MEEKERSKEELAKITLELAKRYHERGRITDEERKVYFAELEKNSVINKKDEKQSQR